MTNKSGVKALDTYIMACCSCQKNRMMVCLLGLGGLVGSSVTSFRHAYTLGQVVLLAFSQMTLGQSIEIRRKQFLLVLPFQGFH